MLTRMGKVPTGWVPIAKPGVHPPANGTSAGEQDRVPGPRDRAEQPPEKTKPRRQEPAGLEVRKARQGTHHALIVNR